ncbi:MAG TPA: DUF2935 domain-containing protein [Bacillus sp. (in: firmicutes)]|uniref:DUF2935 domain-containing protein n=1 Tax=Bacillus litorisediminis TaxID=2922713 RepID=UPI001FAB79D1|nr:DUF2935 domain-containing protein [Bacillus litorisediminis]HWO75675.1 DUF2935 domain-containing protein [Bacillus sp. (in: firmicutes)]
MKSFEQSAIFEHLFWLQVLGDHARFILDSLPAKQQEDIDVATHFKNEYDRLLTMVQHEAYPSLEALTEEAENLTLEFRDYKLSIIRRHVTGKIRIHLTPTFINHMVNELEEYLLIISYLKKGEAPPIFHELHHHLLWLLDAAGHAGAISDSLDAVEKRLKEKSDQYTKHFEQFYLKAVELTGYLRANIESFPALERMNQDVRLEIELFKLFLHEIEELELTERMLGTFAGLMADHMAREECYYLMKLAESAGDEKPDCDPTAPRSRDEM